MDSAAQTLVPDWFEKHQKVRLVVEGVQDAQGLTTGLQDAHRYRAFMNLPGTDLFLEVSPRHAQPATVPRLFFAVALLFLLGMLVSLYALRRDFSKRQRIQVLLQAEVALRCAMENSVAVGLRAWDMDGKILYVNEAFCRMVGYEAVVLVGQSAPLPYWPAEQAHALLQLHRDIIAQGTRSEGAQTQFQHSDGHLVDVLIHEAPLNTADGTQIGWMSSVQDISERKRAQRVAAVQQEKLEASGRLVTVGEVASTLAHELNQPLGALSSFAAGLLNRLRDGTIAQEEVAPVIARIAALADKAGRIIQHVNAFARRRELSLQRLDLMEVLRRVLPDSVERHVRHLHLVDQGAPIWILADAMLLEHLIGNLVGNALDWANHGVVQPQVRVEVLCDATQGMAALVVADSGPGVQQPDQTHIFNAFFSTKEGGMGMGLAICRSIAEAHHGRIEVGRDEVLGGARFTAWFPLADAAVPALSLEKTQ
jgi:two-component system sensor histidine kinase DctS